jgi:diaminopropionate ammonia-lyase
MAIIVSGNPLFDQYDLLRESVSAALPLAGCQSAADDLRQWPVYARTPLVEMPGMAELFSVGRVWVKDEGIRQPLASFKALGAAYALGELLRDKVEQADGVRPSYTSLWAGNHEATARALHVCAATDGNHGRSLAWGAQVLGARCTIYLPANVSPARAAAIGEFGAQIVRVNGNYEDTIMRVVEDSKRDGMVMLQDTSFPGYVLHCQRIMQGYTLIAEEIMDDLADQDPPTHMFVQVGCGGLAAAVGIAAARRYGDDCPRIVTVEPIVADSLRRSIETGLEQVVEGEHPTIMIGMACGEVSLLAWEILKHIAHSAVAIDDGPAIEMLRLSALGHRNDPPMVMGETGAAGAGALMEASRNPQMRGALELDAHSRVVVLNTEGAIDEQLYRSLLAA